MFAKMTMALVVGFPLGALGAWVLVLAARVLVEHLEAHYAATDLPALSLAQCQLRYKFYLDLVLAVSVCLTAVLSVLNWGLSWHALAAALFCATVQVLARIDAQTRLLPDALTLPLLWAGLLFHWLGGWVSLEDAVAGAAVGYGVLWLIWAVHRGCSGRDGIGFGDLKLAAANGAWLGAEALPWALLAASLVACMAALVARFRGRLKRFQAVAFGPYLSMGGILVLFSTQSCLSFFSFDALTALLMR
ncbi:MAG: prepilin peptidase [Zwartia sp.]|jgi:leader peptidase (prepilin peptidase)/N-methyltransferase